jgi:hypothetical protein
VAHFGCDSRSDEGPEGPGEARCGECEGSRDSYRFDSDMHRLLRPVLGRASEERRREVALPVQDLFTEGDLLCVNCAVALVLLALGEAVQGTRPESLILRAGGHCTEGSIEYSFAFVHGKPLASTIRRAVEALKAGGYHYGAPGELLVVV